MPRAKKNVKAPAPVSNVVLFPLNEQTDISVRLKGRAATAAFIMTGDYLDEEYGIKDGDVLLVRDDLPLIAISPAMLCVVDRRDGRFGVRRLIVHNTRDFTLVDPGDGEQEKTSVNETSVKGVVVGIQRSIEYANFRPVSAAA